jgi:adenylate cyclase
MPHSQRTLTVPASTQQELPRAVRALVVVDLVESVRIMLRFEADLVARWTRFVEEIQALALPPAGGRMVKSYGDGLLLEFPDIPRAVASAFDIQARIRGFNAGCHPDAEMVLRIGIHQAEVFVGEVDLYGAGVNLAARLATLASPGEVVVSAEARDMLVDGLGLQLFDLGECFLKHYDQPLRAYRVACAAAPGAWCQPAVGFRDHRLAIAVVPFSSLSADPLHQAIGDALADDIIAALSGTDSLRVISRLSTASFRGRSPDLAELRALLDVSYVVCGSYRVSGQRVTVRLQLCDARSGQTLWADAIQDDIEGIFNGQDVIVPAVVQRIGHEVFQTELERVRTLPINTLAGYSLYVGGVLMLHRLTRSEFQRARLLLEHLGERHPRSAAAPAMLAKWHIMQMVQGWADDVNAAGQRARFHAQRALELDPDNALALAMEAAVIGHLGGDLQEAMRCGQRAAKANPQEPHAWLTLGSVHSYLGHAEPAELHSQRAGALSPIDPARFLFDVFVAAGKLAAGKYAEAASAARSSVRLNAMHPPAHRVLAIALALGGEVEEARAAGRALLHVSPSFRVSEYARRYPGRAQAHAAQHMQALITAGLPA